MQINAAEMKCLGIFVRKEWYLQGNYYIRGRGRIGKSMLLCALCFRQERL